jgi:hypothetical protein
LAHVQEYDPDIAELRAHEVDLDSLIRIATATTAGNP